MKTKIILAALIAAAGLVSSASASAAITTNQGDLLIAFYDPAATTPTAVIYDAGSYTNFTSGTNFTLTGFDVTDLNNTFGGGTTSWTTSSTLVWGVIGATQNSTVGLSTTPNYLGYKVTKNTLFASASIAAASTTIQFNAAKYIDSNYSSLAQTGATAGVGSATYILTSPAGVSGSVIANDQAVPGADYGYFNSGSVFSNAAPGAGTATQNLYEIIATGVSGTTGGAYTLGTFNLSSSGLTFTGAAIPEPSTYAAIFGVAMLGFAAFRRRFQKKA